MRTEDPDWVQSRLGLRDWSGCSLGAPDRWSIGFRTALDICLGARFPAVVYLGPDLVQVFNEAYRPIQGARHERAFGRPVNEVPPQNHREIEPMLRSVYATGRSEGWEDFYIALEREGALQECYFTFSLSRIEDEFGARAVLCIANETTANVLRARAANERVAELAEFKKLADSISDIVFMHGSDGAIGWANERWYVFTGLEHETTFEHGAFAKVTTPDDHLRYVETLARTLPTQSAYEIELRLKPVGASPDDYRWHLIRAKPMFGDDGFLLRWAATATDIHDRRIAAEEARVRLERERDREHRASLAFQDAAMPQRLPIVPGLTFSAVYEAASAEALVGGDWYDAFRLSDGRIVLSVGDVMGSGLASAVTMGAVRQAIRGAAQIYPDPASVLDAADRALRSEQPDAIVTAFVAVLDPLVLSLSYASAGHPPPMLRRPNGEIEEISAPDLPLGLRAERHRGKPTQHQVSVTPGSLLVMYTDGLTETTRDVTEGETRLRAALATIASIDPRNAAKHIRDSVLVTSNDDVAILTVAFGEPTEVDSAPRADFRTRWSFPIVDATAASNVRREIVDLLRRLGASERDGADAELVIGELLGNVMRHAYGDALIILDPSGATPVLHILDSGPGFTFDARLPRDEMSESGRGLYIAAMLTRDLSVAPRAEGGSHARVVFNIEQAHA